MKKRILAVLLSAGMVAGLAGCGSDNSSQGGSTSAPSSEAGSASQGSSNEAADGSYKIGVCLPIKDQYFTTFETAFSAQMEERGIDYQFVVAGDNGEDISTQLSQVQTFNNSGFDACIIAMATGGSAKDFMDIAGDMNVIFFNRAVDDESVLEGETVYIGMNEQMAGNAQGEWLAGYLKEKGITNARGLMFMGTLGLAHTTARTDGAKEALEKAGIEVEWIFEQSGEYDRTKAMNLFTQFAGTGEEFDFVCSNNDEMALGVIEACSASNIEINFPIVGVDATEVGCNAVKAGTMAMTVNQNPIGQAGVVAEAIDSLREGKVPADAVDNKILTDAQTVTIDNVDEVLANF